MPQNPKFEIDSSTVIQVFTSVGVLSDENSNSEITGAFFDMNSAFQGLYVVMPSGDIKFFDIKLTDIVSEYNGAMIGFKDKDGSSYLIRTVGEDDGEWMSKYKIDLPVEILEQKIAFDSKPAFEKIFNLTLPADNVDSFGEDLAVYYGDSDTVSAVVYSCLAGTFVRTRNTWDYANPEDGTYDGDFIAEVKPENAKKVLDAYDDNEDFLNVNDIASLLENNEDTE